jgi:hypothetical protein
MPDENLECRRCAAVIRQVGVLVLLVLQVLYVGYFREFQHLTPKMADQRATTAAAKKTLCSRNNKFGPQHLS